MKTSAIIVHLWFATAASALPAQVTESDVQGKPDSAESQPADLASLRIEAQVFVDAFNRGDAKAVAQLWTEGGEYLDETGTAYVGREAIEKCYSELFTANPNAKMHIRIDSLRLLSNGAAVEDGRAFLDPPPDGNPGFSKYSVFHVKVDGKWLMASVRDQWVETPSTHEKVADLNWLIGTWIAEEHGAKSESDCKWIANKSFVERRFTTTHFDGTKVSGVQLIGWNSEQGHVQSWTFSPDGGHAIGIWSPLDNGWIAEVRGVTGEGLPTTAVNRLIRLDDNAYVWQSVQRAVGGVPLPDSDEVVLKRQN